MRKNVAGFLGNLDPHRWVLRRNFWDRGKASRRIAVWAGCGNTWQAAVTPCSFEVYCAVPGLGAHAPVSVVCDPLQPPELIKLRPQ